MIFHFQGICSICQNVAPSLVLAGVLAPPPASAKGWAGWGHSDTFFFCCHHMEIGRVGLAAQRRSLIPLQKRWPAQCFHPSGRTNQCWKPRIVSTSNRLACANHNTTCHNLCTSLAAQIPPSLSATHILTARVLAGIPNMSDMNVTAFETGLAG